MTDPTITREALEAALRGASADQLAQEWPSDPTEQSSWVRAIGSALRDEAAFRGMKASDSSAIRKFGILAAYALAEHSAREEAETEIRNMERDQQEREREYTALNEHKRALEDALEAERAIAKPCADSCMEGIRDAIWDWAGFEPWDGSEEGPCEACCDTCTTFPLVLHFHADDIEREKEAAARAVTDTRQAIGPDMPVPQGSGCSAKGEAL